jgi:large subunit ribosomal protein L32
MNYLRQRRINNMAVPFRKISKTRKNMRRTHYKATAKGLVKCPNCGETIQSHKVCPKCGFYDGKQVVSVK